MTSPITDLEQRLAEARATAMREGLEEAARIVRAALEDRRRFGSSAAEDGLLKHLETAIRFRASSLPGGDTSAVAARRLNSTPVVAHETPNVSDNASLPPVALELPAPAVSTTGEETTRLTLTRAPERPELEALLREAAKVVMTPGQIREQRKSWVRGRLGLSHPEWDSADLARRVDELDASIYGNAQLPPVPGDPEEAGR